MPIMEQKMKIKDRPLAFPDLETNGVEPLRYKRRWYWPWSKYPVEWHEIIEIGLLLVDQKTLQIINKLDVKIKPAYPERMTEIVLKVNGYSSNIWKDAISLSEAM